MTERTYDLRPCPGCSILTSDAPGAKGDDRYLYPPQENAKREWAVATPRDLILGDWRCISCTRTAWRQRQEDARRILLGRSSSTRRPPGHRLNSSEEIWP